MSYFGNEPQYASFNSDVFSGDGSTIAFALSAAPGSAGAVIVTIDGVKQHTSAYSVSGATLTFTAAPPTGTNNIEVIHLGVRVEVSQPAAGTVSATELSAGQFGGDYIKLSDTKTAGSNGGPFTNGSWQTRTLNTKDVDTGSICTLASNQFTLPAGTYRINAIAPAYKVNRHTSKLYNVTDTTDEIIGTAEISYTTDTCSTSSHVVGQFTITSSKTFELRHYGEANNGTDGFGIDNIGGVSAIFAIVELWKVK